MVRKNSKKRDAILACLRQSKENPTVEMLYRQLKPDYPELSLGTVYRNLAILVEEKQAVNIGSFRGQERYDGRLDPHSHFVCRGCGRVMDLDIPDTVSEIYTEIQRDFGFRLESYALTITGLCDNCAQEDNDTYDKKHQEEESTMKKWICSVCGHVHEGIAPPELCPVCKVTSSHFHLPGEEPAVHVDDPEVAKLRKVIEGVEPATPKPIRKWICPVCGHVHEGTTPPELCPVCKIVGSQFRLPGEELKVAQEDPETTKLRKAIEGAEPVAAKPIRKWVCPVCGHVHEGTTPPELCPVCKIVGSQFRLPGEELKVAQEDPEITKLRKAIEGVEPVAAKPVRKWVCSVCGHVHEGTTPPELCPVCKVTASHFNAAD
ncbi:MAG: transcriptional repressor [Oscillospiraceae bacterium]|nr:transcriptional repressor [Oscillospiraceae bacterium]